MRQFWLFFAQATTIVLAVLFVISTLRPELVPWQTPGGGTAMVTIKEAPIEGVLGTPRPASFADAAEKAGPAVVNVFTTKEVKVAPHPFMDDPFFRRFFGDRLESGPQSRRASSLGSGVLVSPEGYILTNHHVIEAADEIEIALADGRKSKAHVIGSDPETDLAVVKVNMQALPAPMTFGHSDKARVGDIVLAIGNPFGVGQTVTMGIISALGRSHLGINTFENFIQTDAAINPGNSGGALVDTAGNLIGINTAIYSPRPGGASLGIGFAIPASTAKQVLEQIMETGQVTRGWIGVGVQDMTRELSDSFKLPEIRGALITEVFRGTPADKAGIRLGHILVAVEGQPVTDSASMLNLVSALTPGKQATIRLVRSNQETDVRVMVGRRPLQQR